MWKTRVLAIVVLLVGFSLGYSVYRADTSLAGAHAWKSSWLSKYPFHLGLDLSGGSRLTYRADVSAIGAKDVDESMSILRDVIERRVNLFGVSEPVVEIGKASLAGKGEHRLTVELPGVTDIKQATEMIGQTPVLMFKTERPAGPERDGLLKQYQAIQQIQASLPAGAQVQPVDDPFFVATQLTGRYLARATLDFNQRGEPIVSLEFNPEGTKLFADITKANVGKTVAIYLDGSPISTPRVNEEITSGKAQITGTFKAEEARTLVRRLNSGALPVPVELISTETVGATLGDKALAAGAHAAIIGFAFVALFLTLWYRLPGVIAVLALSLYGIITLFLYKLIPVTLTSAGIAGFIISIGMAVDANVLIFERIKEELRSGRTVSAGIEVGFTRAWSSIRDSNISSLISAVILFWFGTALIKGFALTFGLGVLIALLSAILISKLFIRAIGFSKASPVVAFLFGSGFSSARGKK
jgi:preprotein translocase subunit SecD